MATRKQAAGRNRSLRRSIRRSASRASATARTSSSTAPRSPIHGRIPPASIATRTARLKRQSARFRIYGLDANDKAVGRTDRRTNAEITWTVHLANKKAAWYEFQLAQDIPEAESAPPHDAAQHHGERPREPEIDPGPRRISGPTWRMGAHLRQRAASWARRSISASCAPTRRAASSCWAVTASRPRTTAGAPSPSPTMTAGTTTCRMGRSPLTVTVGRHERCEVDPGLGGGRAAELCADAEIGAHHVGPDARRGASVAGRLTTPGDPRSSSDIRPLFERLAGLQWVNEGFAAWFGWRAPDYLVSPEWLARLNNRGADREARRVKCVANQFRRPIATRGPRCRGRGCTATRWRSRRRRPSSGFTTLTPLQLAMLDKWANGDFVADYDPKHRPPRTASRTCRSPSSPRCSIVRRSSSASPTHSTGRRDELGDAPVHDVHAAPYRLRHADRHERQSVLRRGLHARRC